MNTPNKLTIARMIATPIFMAVMLIEAIPYRFLIALVLFSAASLTDMIDGKMARKYNLVTDFGKFLDPIADKVLTTSALLAFMSMGLCNIWIVMIVLTREFAIASVRMVAATNGVVIPANVWGKIKTVSQMVFTILIMLLGEVYFVVESSNVALFAKLPDLSLISNGLLWITAVLTVVSGGIYLYDSRKIIDFTK